jgi:hypothetical protein
LTDRSFISAVCFEVSRLLTPDVNRRATGNSPGSFRAPSVECSAGLGISGSPVARRPG